MLICFGKFELDSRRYQLTCEGRVIKLEVIPMKLLFFLAESKGTLVSRQTITEHLWGRDVFVDAQHSVNTAINKLRAAMRDDLANPRYIQTVKGLGYRFIAEVEVIRGEDSVIETPPVSLASSASIPGPGELADSSGSARAEDRAESVLTARESEDRLSSGIVAETPKSSSLWVSRFAKFGIGSACGFARCGRRLLSPA